MTTVNLDMLAALREAGVSPELAEKAAAQIPPAENLVTKADLKAALAEMELRLTVRMILIASLAVAVLAFLMNFLLQP